MEFNHSTDSAGLRECIECGVRSMRVASEEQKFLYGPPGAEVELRAEVPVWTCSNCGFAYTDEEGENARHEAVCAHLGVLSPSQIRELRKAYGLSQSEFAKLTAIGEASIKRWESGVLIQNSSSDRFMRLLFNSQTMRDLRQIALGHSPSQMPQVSPVRRARFRTNFSDETIKYSKSFKLRRSASS